MKGEELADVGKLLRLLCCSEPSADVNAIKAGEAGILESGEVGLRECETELGIEGVLEKVVPCLSLTDRVLCKKLDIRGGLGEVGEEKPDEPLDCLMCVVSGERITGFNSLYKYELFRRRFLLRLTL